MREDRNIVKFPDLASLEAEAAEWVARLDGDSCGAEERAKFQEWLSRSPLHREVAGRYLSLWTDLDLLRKVVPARKPLRTEDPSRRSLMLLWYDVMATPWRTMGYAAAAAALLCTLWIGHGLLYGALPQQHLLYQTAVGGQKNVTLADGSNVLINTDSAIEVSFTDGRRDVRLLRGEAYFDVVHDPGRPFTVYSGNRVVRDIGTAFAVRLVNKAVEVTVTKGAVELTAQAEDGSIAQRPDERLGVVTAGQNARFDRKIDYIKPLSNSEIKRQLAWRRGYLEYSGEPLAQVIADVSRYTNIKIALDDAKLEAIPVGGYFAIDKMEAVFVALEKNFGIHAEWQDASHVRLVATNHTHGDLPTPREASPLQDAP